MFCFQAPFQRRERDKPISGNSDKLVQESLSHSAHDLNRLTLNKSKVPAISLCLSDSNISGVDTNLESKKWERWRANAKLGLHLGLLLSSNDESQKNKVDATPKAKPARKVSKNYEIITEETTVPCNLDSEQVNDIQYIDESDNAAVNTSPKICEESKDCFNDENISQCGNVTRQPNILKQKSISAQILDDNLIESFNDSERILKTQGNQSEPMCDLSGNGDVRVIVHRSDETSGVSQEIECNTLLNDSNESCKIDFEDENKSKKRQNQQKLSTSPFSSFCSLFNLTKGANKTGLTFSKNNEIRYNDQDTPISFQHNIIATNISCCPLSSPSVSHVIIQEADSYSSSIKNNFDNIINKSPKSKNGIVFNSLKSINDSSQCRDSAVFSSDSSPGGTSSSDGIAPMASPEDTSPAGSVLSSPVNSGDSTGFCEVSQEHLNASTSKSCSFGSNLPSPISLGYSMPRTKFKLLNEGDVQVCYLNHTRTIISKVLSSKFLRRWETHHIYLNNDCISSKTPTGFLESPVPYSNLEEVYVVGRWDQGNRFCIRLVVADGSLLLQTNSSLVRDQWLYSILWKKNMHKYRNILQKSTRPEVILKEIKGLIYLSLNSPLQDDCVINVPIEIISKLLIEDEIWTERQRRDEVIIALAPLLEDTAPSPEMCQFFSQHCILHPRSPVVIDVFTSIVHRILKRTVDFGKSPLMRHFVADYLKALNAQNDGEEAIRKFVSNIHGPSCGCPHQRVLPNLVAVNLAAVFSHFEQRRMLLMESNNETNSNQAVQLMDKQLQCYTTLFLIISEFEDWRPGLAQLLQPIPFPDDALSHEAFIKGFTPVIKRIGTDPRCDVHEMILGIRETKEGWLHVYCPSSLVCSDEGALWCQMLQTLFNCCCRRKSFLQKMVKHLGALLLVALRDHAIAQEILCLMLEWRLINGEDQEMQVVTTLQSTESGRLKYNELCKRQEHLKELQKKGGPRKLTLPSRSTDGDVACLLSCGSFGNLECLSLAFTHVTSACANQLIQLPSLRYLNLWATQFGDAGLIIIAEHLDKLQVLNLCETPVSDKGIAALVAMKNLKKLNLNSTKLSPQTLETLKQKLPSLQELDVRYTDAW